MSKSRRSLIRSTLQRIRQLWQRRKDGRRDMRRALGTTFEPLEPRLALTVSSPEPNPTDHIHPFLQIYLEGQQVVIPSGVGITTTSDANPHTHDLTGELHIGEGGNAGTGNTVRKVTLDDFFDVWASSTLTQASARNANALLDTDLTDGTASPRIMDKTVNPDTHVLRMYVKEAGDAAPELEYDSSRTTNGIARPEDYIPRDGDRIILSYDKIANVADTPSFQPIATQTVLVGAPSLIGIDGFDPLGGPLTYSVTSSNPNLLTATLMPSSNQSLVLTVDGFGQMTFQLLDNFTPLTTQHIKTLVDREEFKNSASNPVKFYRIAHLANGSDFVIQGGPSDSTSSLGQFSDEFNKDLQFTTGGLLAMAKSDDDTNDSQIFVTAQAVRFLDMNHSIFGVLTDGDEVRNAINKSSTENTTTANHAISGAQIVNDSQNAALMLKAAAGATGTATVTLTVSDAQGHSFAQQFTVNLAPDTINSDPFLNNIGPVTGVQGQPITVQLTATDVENNTVFFDAFKPTSETVNYTFTVNHDTGLVTINPPTSFAGTFRIEFGVRGVPDNTGVDEFDTQSVLVSVGPAGPSSVDLVAESDSGTSNSDNITNATSLNFLVSGVTVGATVKLMKGETVLAQGVANSTTITLNVPSAATALGQGDSNITARQDVSGQTSNDSPALKVTFDSTGPTFTSTAPASAPVGFNLNYNAQTNEEGPGLVYTLTTPPTGATINSSTGVVTWTPTSGQASTTPIIFNVVATDAAGNATTQEVNVTVAAAAVDFTLRITRPDGTALTTLSPGQEFVLHFFAEDIRSQAEGVFAAYTDIRFDSTKATVNGQIAYNSIYANARTGSTTTAGLIDEVGAFTGNGSLDDGPLEVFSIPMKATATATGTLQFSMDPADGGSSFSVLVLGQNPPIPPSQIRFGTASIEVGSTFNAVNDAFNASEDTSNNTINPLANDASIGGATNTLTITAVGTRSNGGNVTITQNGTRLAYTPAGNFAGTETFTYTVRNQSGEEHTATVTMTVADVNDPPVAVNDSLSATRNSTNNVLDVLANDTKGPDTTSTADTLRVASVSAGSQGGTLTIPTNGANVIYTPKANFSGTETFTYTIRDRATGGLTSTATLTVSVSGLTATADTFTVTEDSAAAIFDVLANDVRDDAGGTLTITAFGAGDKGGIISIAQNGTRISYEPADNAQGTEKFTYTISDGLGHTAIGTVTMTITNTNDAPTATADTLTAFKDTTATFDVLANDKSDPDPTETLTIDAITTQPQHGTATIVNGKVQYVPTTGYTGPDSFTYTIKDPGGLTSTATASITVQDFAPSSLAGFVYFDVNNNGIKDAGESSIVGITITLTGTPTAGSTTPVNLTAKTAEDGSYKFENLAPGTNYTITQTAEPLFTIDGRDRAGSLGGIASRTTGSNPQDRIVIATLAQASTGTNYNFGERGRALSTINLRDFFSSTSRNFAIAAFNSTGAEIWHTTSGAVWTGTTSNAFSLNSTKTQLQLQSTNGQSQVTTRNMATDLPVYLSGQSGTSRLYYFPGGPHGSSTAPGPTPTNQAPTAVNDAYLTPVSTALTVAVANGVLKNDTDPESNTLTAAIVTQPANGTLTLNSNGSFTYTPTTGFTGVDTFTYRANDGKSNSAPATVSISVGVNTAPTAAADTYSTTEDAPLTVTTTNSLLNNDTDPEGQTLTAIIGTQPTKGTLTAITNGTFTYTPTANANGTDTFTYKVSDGTNESAFATVTITIAPINDGPIAGPDSFTTDRDTALPASSTRNLLANDTDIDNTTLVVSTTPVTNPAHGTVTLNADGTFTYNPTSGFAGSDTFTYQVSDGTLTANGTVTITINAGTNNAPVANPDAYTLDEDIPAILGATNGILFNDTDQNDDDLTAIVDTQPTHGTLVLNTNDGSFTYTPNANYNGPDSFVYHANDGTVNSAPATVTFNVVAVNDAPAGGADSYRVNADTPLVVNAANGLLKNDTDADHTLAQLTAGDVTQPVNGEVTVAADGSFTYTPDNGFQGTDSFTYRAADPTGDKSGIITVTIIVNTAPVASNDSYNATEDTTLSVNTATGLLLNDSDANGDTPLIATVVAQPEHGTVTINVDGSFTYTPNEDYNGPDSFRYQVSDGLSSSAPATVSITVAAKNDAPERTAGTLAPVNVETDSANDTAVTLGLAALTYGPGGAADEASQTLTYKVTNIPSFVTLFKADGTTAVAANSTLTLAELQGLKYKTVAGASGGGNVTFTVQDSGGTANGGVDTLTENLAVTVGVNDPPVRTGGSPAAINVAEDSANTAALTLGLAGLAYSPGGGSTEAGQTLTYKITAIPAYMTVFKEDGATPVLVNATLTLAELQGLKFKTVENASGTGNLTWTVQDNGGSANGGSDTLTETLAVTVNGVNDIPARTAGSPAAINVAEDSNNTTAVALGLTALEYGPGGGTAEASQTLTYKITAIPSFISLFKADGTTAVTVNSTLTLAELRGLKYKTLDNGGGTGSLTWTVQDSGGTANGGSDTLTETLAITVNSVNDAPVLTSAAPPANSVAEDSATTTAVALGLSAVNYGPGGGADEANQTVTYKITSIPAFVTLFKSDGTTAVVVNDTLTLAELQGLKYKTVADASGSATITWTVQDSGGTAGGGVDTLTQTLAIAVNALNDAPARTAGTLTPINVATDSANDSSITLGLTGLNYGPGGGSTESNQTLTYKITAIPSFVLLFKADGTTAVAVDATLTLAELQGLEYKTVAGASGAGNITWTVQDNGGTSGGGLDTLTENLSITVGVNEPPVSTGDDPDPISVAEDSANATAATLGLAGLVYSPGGAEEAGQTLTYKITAIPDFVAIFKEDGTTAVAVDATLTLAELQGLMYKTLADTVGDGNLTWTVQDNGGTTGGGIDTLTETLAITVNAVNDVPERTAGSPAAITVAEDIANATAVTLALSALDYGPGGGADEDSQTFTYTITAIPAFVNLFKADGTTAVAVDSTLTLAELQELKYKTLANASGTGNLTWTVKDSGGTDGGGIDTLTETLAITVSAVNDAPIQTAGDPANITVDEDTVTTALTLGLSALDYGPGGGADEDGQTFTYTVSAIPTFVNVFKADGLTPVAADEVLTLAELRNLTYTTVADANGTGDLTWAVKDTGGTDGGGVDTLTDNLTITVNAINDAPSFTLTGNPPDVTDNTTEQQQSVPGFVTDMLAGPSDEVSQTLTFDVIVTGATGDLAFTIAPAIDANGNLTYTPEVNSSGVATISVRLTDNGGGVSPNVDASAPQTFEITVLIPGGGEGESAGISATDLAMLMYLESIESANSVDNWQDAVDAAMSQLG